MSSKARLILPFSHHLVRNCSTSQQYSLIVTDDPGKAEVSISPKIERFKVFVDQNEKEPKPVPVSTEPKFRRRLPPLPSIADVRRLYKIQANKYLSQNFLLNPRLIDKFVRSAKIKEGMHVVEIGPGPGNITRSILEKNPAELYVIEKDRRFLPLLEQLADAASPGQLKIILGDAMDYSLANLFPEHCKVPWDDPTNESICFIGNLPFNVSIPLTIRWLRQISLRAGPFEYGRVPLTLTFQNEVAQRLAAPCVSDMRARISVMTQTFCHVDEKFVIKGKSFLPAPNVDVGVVRLIPRRVSLLPPEMDFSTYERFVRTLFNARRNPLEKALKKFFPPGKEMFVDELIRRSGFRSQDMALMLSTKEVALLAQEWFTLCKENPGLIDYDFRARKKPPKILKEMFPV